MNAQWHEISVTIPHAVADVISNKLIELGSQGTLFEDHPENPNLCKITAYYSQDRSSEILLSQIRHYIEILWESGFSAEHAAIISKTIDIPDWSTNWKQYFKPTRVGKHLIIKPSWETCDQQSDDVLIEIDPGMAFGTGLHASTRLILALLEDSQPQGKTVLDVGVGSGILSIAAAHLGAADVLGIDIDADAVAIARENVAKNSQTTPQIHELIKLCVASLDTLRITKKFDCILMNIRPSAILALMPYVTLYLQANGLLILSGILETEGPQLLNQICTFDFTVRVQQTEDGWIAYVLSQKNGASYVSP